MAQPSQPDGRDQAETGAVEQPDARVAAVKRARAAPITALAFIVLAALGLRLWGIQWSLPNMDHLFSYHPDEGVNLAFGVLDRGELRPHVSLGLYNYGTLFFYLWQVSAAINRAYGMISLADLTSASGSPTSIASILLVGRILSAVLGAATVVLVWATARRMYGASSAWIAAFTAAITPIAVMHGHFATVDVSATFFVCLCLYACSRCLTAPTARNLMFAGAAAGLAAATKYTCAVVLVAAVATAWTAETPKTPARPARLAACLAGCALAFLVACPAVWMEFGRFWKDFSFEIAKSRQGMGLLFVDTGNGFVYHLATSLRFALGVPLLLAALVAGARAVQRRSRADVLLLAFGLVYFCVIGLAQVRFVRYVLPLMPVVAILVGALMAEWLAKGGRRAVCAAATLGVVGFATALNSAGICSTMASVDARDRALVYLRETAKPGQSIAFATTPWYWSPPLLPEFTSPVSGDSRRNAILASTSPYVLRLPAKDTEWDMAVLAEPRPDYVVLSDLETEDVLRIAWAPARPFLDALRVGYREVRFRSSSSLFGFSLPRPGYVPNDWLYTMPAVSIYARE